MKRMNVKHSLQRASAVRLATAVIATALWMLLCGPLVAIATPGAHGPNGEHLDTPPTGAAQRQGLGRLPDGSVNVPMSAQRRMGIRTAMPEPGESRATVRLTGRVQMDPNAGGVVQPAQAGRIEADGSGLPVMGQTVRRGQVLAWVRPQAQPSERAAQQSTLNELRTARQLAEQRVQRLSALEGSIPAKDLQQARAEAASLAARENAIAQGLGGREALRAPVDGVIASTTVVSGQVVSPGETLWVIVSPTRLMVEAQTADVQLINRIHGASLQGLPDVKLEPQGMARVLRDGVLPVNFQARSNSGTSLPLAVGQTVTVVVALTDTLQGTVLPAQAVVRNPANETIVWIKSGAERYIAQPVVSQSVDATQVIVTQGLGAGNRVVVQGAALLSQIR